MAKHLIIIEALISLWYIKEMFSDPNSNIFKMLMLLLVYLCLNAIYFIYYEKKFYRLITSLVLVAFVVLAARVFQPMSYFLGITAYLAAETMIGSYDQKNVLLAGVSILYALVLQVEYLDTFFLITLFSLLSLNLDRKSWKIINGMKKESGELWLELDRQRQDLLHLKMHELNKGHVARLEERNLVAQKLHDEIGHTLSGSTMQIEAALLLWEQSSEKSKQILQKVIANLRAGTDSIRKILKSIKPETASLNIQSLKLLVYQTQEQSGIAIDLIYSEDLVFLSMAMWQVVIINVKEALTNLMKYSQATKCSVRFEKLNKRYKVAITDNGIGCHNIVPGMGLAGMEERVHQIGGQLIVDGADGFSIIMLLPLAKGV